MLYFIKSALFYKKCFFVLFLRVYSHVWYPYFLYVNVRFPKIKIKCFMDKAKKGLSLPISYLIIPQESQVVYWFGTAQRSLGIKLKSTKYLIVNSLYLLNWDWLVFQKYIFISIKYYPISARIGPQIWKFPASLINMLPICEKKS